MYSREKREFAVFSSDGEKREFAVFDVLGTIASFILDSH